MSNENSVEQLNKQWRRAVMLANMELVKYLVQNGASINYIDAEGDMPIHRACTMPKAPAEIVAYLIDNGAQINERGYGGYTPLMIASNLGNFPIVKLLIERGAKIDLVDYSQKTALHHAASAQHIGIYNYLISLGIDENISDVRGRTAKDIIDEFKSLHDDEEEPKPNPEVISAINFFITLDESRKL